MKKTNWFVWLLDHIEEIFLCCLLVLISAVMFVQVFSRYVLHSALSWTDEFCRYCFIWMIFIGMSYAVKNNSHLRVDLLEQFFPKLKKPMEIMTDIAFLIFSIYMISPGLKVLKAIAASNQKSVVLRVPVQIIYLSFFIGLCLNIIRIIQKYLVGAFGKNNKTEGGDQ